MPPNGSAGGAAERVGGRRLPRERVDRRRRGGGERLGADGRERIHGPGSGEELLDRGRVVGVVQQLVRVLRRRVAHGTRQRERRHDHHAQPDGLLAGHADELHEPGLDRLRRPTERVGERGEVGLAQRQRRARRHAAQLVDHREVLAEHVVGLRRVAKPAHRVADADRRMVGRDVQRVAAREEIRHVDAARAGEAPQVTLGDLGATALVGGELAARQPGRARDDGPGQALLLPHLAKVPADVLRGGLVLSGLLRCLGHGLVSAGEGRR